MNFSFNSADVKASNPSKLTKLPVGIHENCLLKTFEKGTTQNGVQYIEFVWENESLNGMLNKRVWYPNEANPMPREGETNEQAIQRQINDAAGIFLHILETYMTSKDAEFSATSFDNLVDVVIQKLNKHKVTTVPVFLKVIKDRNNYSALPKFPRWTEKCFEGKKSTLSFTKWELENAMGKEETTSTNPFLSSDVDETDVPF